MKVFCAVVVSPRAATQVASAAACLLCYPPREVEIDNLTSSESISRISYSFSVFMAMPCQWMASLGISVCLSLTPDLTSRPTSEGTKMKPIFYVTLLQTMAF